MTKRSDALYLDDIMESVRAIGDFISGYDFDRFSSDRKTYSATIREFEVIGEAIGKISDEIKLIYPEVSWRDIRDFRNLLIHQYFGVDAKILWNTAINDLPELGKQIKEIVKKEAEKENE